MDGSRKWPVRRKKWRAQKSTVQHRPTKTSLAEEPIVWSGFRSLNNLGSSAVSTAQSLLRHYTRTLWMVILALQYQPGVQNVKIYLQNVTFKCKLEKAQLATLSIQQYNKVKPRIQKRFHVNHLHFHYVPTLTACVKQMCWNRGNAS